MFSLLQKLASLLNPANRALFVGQQLKKPSGIFAAQVAKSMNVSNQNLYNLTFNHLNLNDHDNILEIGFGNGRFFEQLSRKNQSSKIFGLEISKEMVRQCIRLNNQLIANQTLKIKQFDGLILPYRDEMFDKQIAINLIYFWQNPIEHIRELNRVLKSNGELFIGIRPFDVLSRLPFAQESFNIQPDSWWIELFETGGFQLIHSLSTTELPLQFSGKTYTMSGTCWIFKKYTTPI